MTQHTPPFSHPIPPERQQLGFDEDTGNWELGVFPLVLALPQAVRFAQRVRQQRQAQGKQPLLRSAIQRFQNRQGQQQQQPQAPGSQSPAQSALPGRLALPQNPAGGGLFSRFQLFRGEAMDTTNDLIGAMMRRPGGRPPMGRRFCRVKRRGGRLLAYDPQTGDEVEVMGFDDEDGGGQYMGADGDDTEDYFLGGDEGDDADIDELGEAEEELLGGASYDDEQTFAGKEERLKKRIAKLEGKAEKIRDKMDDLRGPFKNVRRKRLNKRLKRIVKRLEKARGKLRKAQGKRKDAIREADKTLKAAGLGAAAAAGGAAGAGVVLSSRSGQAELAKMNSTLENPLAAERMRRAQAAAGLEGNYRAPAGGGRLQPVPMTEDGTTNPRNAITVPAGGLSTNTTLFAEVLSYAEVFMVGFLSSQRGTDLTNGAIGLVEDLKIQGSGNLFLQEGPVPANYYDTDIDRLTPLRKTVKVKSPNQAQVDIAAAGDQNDVVILTCSAVYDVIYDDTYGPGFPGPYA